MSDQQSSEQPSRANQSLSAAGQQQFDPPADLTASANVTAEEFERAAADPEGFWLEQAKERLTWGTEPTESLDWSNPPFAKWFADGTLNAAVNCLDRHVDEGHGDRVAYYFEGDRGDTETITYADLTTRVKKAANALTELGVKAGDRVAIYMPMIPETIVAMLACARIGAPHTVIFGGFSAHAVAARIKDCGVETVITTDGQYRRGQPAPLKPAVDEAIEDLPQVRNVLVVRRTGEPTQMREGRDVWWHDVVDRQSEEHTAEMFEAEHPLYIMYTSGSTGSPKGILHTTAGYLLGTSYTHWATFDIKPDEDVFWTAADVGWVTGHSYMVYGPLVNGTTQVLYEGTPDSPHKGRWWDIIEKYKVTILYCAPTAIRTFMKWGEEIPQQHDLTSLRLIGSVGEPINPEAYLWYRKYIGGDRCPVVDTWWQTETGMHMITIMPGVHSGKPGSAQKAIPGVNISVVNDAGHPVEGAEQGYLVIDRPWPAMLRTIWGNDQRFLDAYWSRFEGKYFAGDGARLDEDGDIWLLGRVDDVMNVSGHRLSTAEIESSLVAHPAVAEAAVVGASDPTTGQGIVAFVILRQGQGALENPDDDATDIVAELRRHVARDISPIARPRQLFIVEDLPKTRSGKIMRRLLRDIAENREMGDVTTLADTRVTDQISEALTKNPKSAED